MIYYINNSVDPHFNLALEEYLITNLALNDEILLLWQNENAIIVGRNQNTIEEINNEYVRQQQVNVVRRLSGGGAVYHDLGNLNFTFIFNKSHEPEQNYYQLFTQPIVSILQKMGLKAQFSGKNDIVIDDKKISGNAQYRYNNRILHHGTILFNVNMAMLPKVLNPDLAKLQSKGIKSVSARVTNILPLLKTPLTIAEFKQAIIAELKATKKAQIVELSPDMIKAVNKIAAEKYRTWDWNYGKSPTFNLQNKTRVTDKGTIDVRLNVENGVIKQIKIFGDFLGFSGTSALEQQLINQKYNLATITAIIEKNDINSIFGPNFTKKEIISSIIK